MQPVTKPCPCVVATVFCLVSPQLALHVCQLPTPHLSLSVLLLVLAVSVVLLCPVDADVGAPSSAATAAGFQCSRLKDDLDRVADALR